MCSTLELHGNFMVNDLKQHCDIYLVFLEGGILANIHWKPQIPRLMGNPQRTRSGKPTVLIISDSDNDSSGTLVTKGGNKPTNISDHTYSSLQAHVVTSNEPTVSSATNPQGDHTYTEMSDVQSEPYTSSNNDEIITTGGKLVISRSEQVEISVEYRCNIAFPEATVVNDDPDEQQQKSQSSTEIPTPDVQDQVMSPDEINAVNQVLLDETPQPNMQNKPLCIDETKGKETQSEFPDGTHGSVSAVLLDEPQPSKDTQSALPDGTPSSLSTVLLDKPTEPKHLENEEPKSESGDTTLDAIKLPEEISESLNNPHLEFPIVDNSETLESSSVKSVNLNENSMELDKTKSEDNITKKANLKSCIIQLTELSNEEHNKWMEKSESIINSETGITLPLTPHYYMRARPKSTNK